MSSEKRVVLLSCGSFNPVTNMHLRMFELARDHLNHSGFHQVVGGVISPVNDGYPKSELISAKHRCKMVDLALRTSDWIRLDCWESDQATWLPTVKVLAHHQECLDSIVNANDQVDSVAKKQRLDYDNLNYPFTSASPKKYSNWDLSEPAKIMLLCGADLLESFANLKVWSEKDIKEIVSNYGLVTITRKGSDPEQFINDSDLLYPFKRNIHIVREWIPNEVSSTRIRRALRRHESVKYLIPDPVLKYITEHCLYQTSKS